jgi:tRNA modification GTPase
VIRVSGPDALDVYSQMVRVRTGVDARGKRKELAPEPWRMQRCSVVHPGSQEVLDGGMAVFFKCPSFAFCEPSFVTLNCCTAPQSFTAEHNVELHTHSGPAVLFIHPFFARALPKPTSLPNQENLPNAPFEWATGLNTGGRY